MPLYGKIGDVYGRKRVLLFAIGLFVLGSVACGFAQSMPMLLAARAVQGIGGGGLPVLGMAILGDLVPPRQLGRWLGYQGMLFAGAVVVGPLLGGFFVDHLSWRWAFFINVPFAILAVAILVPRLHLPFRRIEHAIDYVGSALLTVALAALVVLATAGGNDVDWVSPGSRVVSCSCSWCASSRSCGANATRPSRSCRCACSRTRCCGSRRRSTSRPGSSSTSACSSSRSSSRRWPGSTPPSRASC